MAEKNGKLLVSDEHISVKNVNYWLDLVEGVTGRYKTAQLSELMGSVDLPADSAVVDIGCGTSTLSRLVASMGGVDRIVCVDYDAQIVADGKAAEEDPRVEWRVADARDLPNWTEKIGAVSYFDVLHEIYSFEGREETGDEIDHTRGLQAVFNVLEASADALEPGGIIIITDDFLPDEEGPVQVRCRTADLSQLVRRIVDEYPSRRLQVDWVASDIFRIPARHWATLLTQYNKLKRGDLDRWRVEQMEVHQYLSQAEFTEFFGRLGLEPQFHIGTPEEALKEWDEDFEILEGLEDFPSKRVALIATKMAQESGRNS